MTADALEEAIQLIKTGKKLEARKILEPLIIQNPTNIQAWVWEIETRESDSEKIKLMDACLQQNPDAVIIRKAVETLRNKTAPLWTSVEDNNSAKALIDEFLPDSDIIADGESRSDLLMKSNEIASESPFISLENIDETQTSPLARDKEEQTPQSMDQIEIQSGFENGNQELVEPFESEWDVEFSSDDELDNPHHGPFTASIDYVKIPFTPHGVDDKNNCPFCGAEIQEPTGRCGICGRLLGEITQVIEEIPVAQKMWYRRRFFKIFTFIFFMPFWCFIELGDPDARKSTKTLARILLFSFLVMISLFVYWRFVPQTDKTRIENWYHNLVSQTFDASDGILHVNGILRDSGAENIGLIELEARVYDKEGALIGSDVRYIDGSTLVNGVPYIIKLDVLPIFSSLKSGTSGQ